VKDAELSERSSVPVSAIMRCANVARGSDRNSIHRLPRLLSDSSRRRSSSARLVAVRIDRVTQTCRGTVNARAVQVHRLRLTRVDCLHVVGPLIHAIGELLVGKLLLL
jgi:hypothetical protein